MQPSTRTPEGEPNRCPVCGKEFRLEPSRPPGDAPCPHCGCLNWFGPSADDRATDAVQYDALLRYACEKIDRGEVEYGTNPLHLLRKGTPHRLDCRRALWKTQKRSGTGPKWKAVFNADNRRRLERAKEVNDWKAIEVAADDCLEYEPLDGQLHLDLGNAYLHQGLHEQAIFALQCALELLPQRSDVRATLDGLLKSRLALK
jgi:tetratricopeptide (TPR) repeat protein